MKIAAFAPHLAGRMLPEIFSYLGIGAKERFPGDPAAHQEPWAAWFWMHTTACGSPNHIGSWSDRQMGAYRFVPADRLTWPEADWIFMSAPPATKQKPHGRNSRQDLKAEGASSDASDRGPGAVTCSGIGPTSAGQPADAGPLAGQYQLFAEITT